MDKTKLLKELRNKGYKVTPQRQEIIEVLSEREGHQSAEEVHKRICSHYPAMGLDTVYRNLALLRNLNIVSEINFGGKNRYELNRDGDGHSHHLICLGCGVSQKLDFCPLDYFDWNKVLKKDFKVKNHRFEIFGYCSHCIQIEENEGEGEE